MAGSPTEATAVPLASTDGLVLAWVALTDPRDPEGHGADSFRGRAFDGLYGAEQWLAEQAGIYDCGLGPCPRSAEDLETYQAERDAR